MTTQKEQYIAVVQRVVRDGKHGSYAVATSDQIEGSITFSLSSDVWKEKDEPQAGFEVVLRDVRSKRAGWRAHYVRFVRPTDKTQQRARR